MDEADDQMKMDLELPVEKAGSRPRSEPQVSPPTRSQQSDDEVLAEVPAEGQDQEAPKAPRPRGDVPPPPADDLDLPAELSQHWCFKVNEVAHAYQVSEKTIRREIWAGRLEVLRVGGSIRITRPALQAWLKKRKRRGEGA